MLAENPDACVTVAEVAIGGFVRDSAHESAVMVSEAHHRFFNSMQVVLAMTNGILRDGGCNSAARARLETLQARVIHLAEINRCLCGPFGSDALSLPALQHLCTALARGFERSELQVSIVVEGQVEDAERCRILLLLLNELMTNALKHSPCDARVGVHIGLTTTPDESRLVVRSTASGAVAASARPRIAAELAETAGGTLFTTCEANEFQVLVVLPRHAAQINTRRSQDRDSAH